ncbi:hypothetical protein C7M84_018855 [Penaeus vannamei]|uniref:Uncharacterized protein n=1 Tax=Penaeus vannamei TaxID=6689 RepID=A0A423SGK0_PENVA|nr:hypothetical protein C7M84_018855 [Penaeus vannamei]
MPSRGPSPWPGPEGKRVLRSVFARFSLLFALSVHGRIGFLLFEPQNSSGFASLIKKRRASDPGRPRCLSRLSSPLLLSLLSPPLSSPLLLSLPSLPLLRSSFSPRSTPSPPFSFLSPFASLFSPLLPSPFSPRSPPSSPLFVRLLSSSLLPSLPLSFLSPFAYLFSSLLPSPFSPCSPPSPPLFSPLFLYPPHSSSLLPLSVRLLLLVSPSLLAVSFSLFRFLCGSLSSSLPPLPFAVSTSPFRISLPPISPLSFFLPSFLAISPFLIYPLFLSSRNRMRLWIVVAPSWLLPGTRRQVLQRSIIAVLSLFARDKCCSRCCGGSNRVRVESCCIRVPLCSRAVVDECCSFWRYARPLRRRLLPLLSLPPLPRLRGAACTAAEGVSRRQQPARGRASSSSTSAPCVSITPAPVRSSAPAAEAGGEGVAPVCLPRSALVPPLSGTITLIGFNIQHSKLVSGEGSHPYDNSPSQRTMTLPAPPLARVMPEVR